MQKAPETVPSFFDCWLTAEGREDEQQKDLIQICLFLNLFNIILIIGNKMLRHIFLTLIMIRHL